MNFILRYSVLFFIGMFFWTWIHEAAHALAALTLGLGIDQFIQIPLGPGQVDPSKWGSQPSYIIVIVAVAPYILYLVLGALTIAIHKPNLFALVGYGVFANLYTSSYVDFGIIASQIGIYTVTLSVSLQYLSLIVIIGFLLEAGYASYLEIVKKMERQGR